MKKRIFVIAIAVVVITFIIGTVIYTSLNPDNGTKGISYTPDQPQPWNEKLPDKNNAEGIRIPGFGRLYFPAGSDKVQITLANPAENQCAFIYTINLNEPDGELLYTSCEIDPGMALTQITLSRPLGAGEYTLYIHVTPYDIQSGSAMNNALLKAPLTVTDE